MTHFGIAFYLRNGLAFLLCAGLCISCRPARSSGSGKGSGTPAKGSTHSRSATGTKGLAAPKRRPPALLSAEDRARIKDAEATFADAASPLATQAVCQACGTAGSVAAAAEPRRGGGASPCPLRCPRGDAMTTLRAPLAITTTRCARF